MGTGYQYLFGICLDGITGTIFAREREKKNVSREILREISRGNFPEEGREQNEQTLLISGKTRMEYKQTQDTRDKQKLKS